MKWVAMFFLKLSWILSYTSINLVTGLCCELPVCIEFIVTPSIFFRLRRPYPIVIRLSCVIHSHFTWLASPPSILHGSLIWWLHVLKLRMGNKTYYLDFLKFNYCTSMTICDFQRPSWIQTVTETWCLSDTSNLE